MLIVCRIECLVPISSSSRRRGCTHVSFQIYIIFFFCRCLPCLSSPRDIFLTLFCAPSHSGQTTFHSTSDTRCRYNFCCCNFIVYYDCKLDIFLLAQAIHWILNGFGFGVFFFSLSLYQFLLLWHIFVCQRRARLRTCSHAHVWHTIYGVFIIKSNYLLIIYICVAQTAVWIHWTIGVSLPAAESHLTHHPMLFITAYRVVFGTDRPNLYGISNWKWLASWFAS